MNERIIELAKQAGYNPLSPPTFADELNEIFMQKFAELIIQKCAGIANKAELYQSSDLIRKHFGVK